jgi:hypothetical protein
MLTKACTCLLLMSSQGCTPNSGIHEQQCNDEREVGVVEQDDGKESGHLHGP